MTTLLKLRAQDGEDIQVISAVLQDSIVPICDMVFQDEDKKFILVAQRLCRENNASERICCALTIHGVTGVQTHGIDQNQRDDMFDLLALLLDPSGTFMDLIFAGNARIRLDLAEWGVLAADFGESWPTLCNPCHDSSS